MRLERTLFALALFGFAAAAAAQGWSPKRSVEIVVGFAAGGSQDLTARTVERLLVAHKLVNVPIAVVNKPGASGSIAYAYVSQRPGDGHTLMVAGTSLISGHILGTSAFNYTDFTPIASLFNDYIAFSVNAASPLRTGNDLIERLKKDPKSLTIGIISIGSGAHVSALLLHKAIGGNARDLKVVSFKAGTEVITNVLGGHIELATTTAVVAQPHVAAGRMRVVAVASPRRLGGALAGVPTWTEQGVDLVSPQLARDHGAEGNGCRADRLLGECAAEGDRNRRMESRSREKSSGSTISRPARSSARISTRITPT